MSMRALLLAVESRVQSITGLDSKKVGVRPDGAPPAFSGETYIAIHPGAFSNETQESLDELYAVDITFTRRTGYIPDDRLGSGMLTQATTGAYAMIEQIRAGLHMDYVSMNAANTTLGGSVNGFVEPLRFQNCSAPQEVGADWFNGVEGAGGLVWLLSFFGARRVQTLESQA